jgi:uncharacterized protein (TIRG00374 family)
MMGEKPKSWLRSGITWALTVGVAVYVVLRIDWANARQAAAQADWRYLAPALLVTAMGNLLVGPARWRLILGRLGCRIALRQAVFVKIAGSPIKFVVPMKMGEFFRAFYLSRHLGHNLERALSSVLMEKVANMLAAGTFLVAGLALGGIRQWRWEALAVTAAFLAAFVLPGGRRLVAAMLGRLSRGLRRRCSDVLSALAELSLADKLVIFLYSLLFVLTELVIAFLAFRALGMRVPVLAFLVFTPLSILASIPTFSGIGTREAAAAWFFSASGPFLVDYGTPEARVLAGFLVTLIYYLFPTIVGLPWSRTFAHRCIWKDAEAKPLAEAERAT